MSVIPGRGPGRTRTQRRHRLSMAAVPLLLAAGGTLLVACGGGSSNRSSTATQPPAQSSTTASGVGAASAPASTGPTVISVKTAEFGTILADAKGMALYTATGDTATQSGCTGGCLTAWPPLLLPAGQSQPVAGPGVTGLGIFMRSEGVQVTYHGKPLYTWFKDTSPGQVTGQGVVDSGGTWFVATVTSAATSPAAGTPSTQAPSVTQAPPATQAPATPATSPSTAPGGGVSY
jgi:predicted lipoprotein with Yx(FWY)xxD motif